MQVRIPLKNKTQHLDGLLEIPPDPIGIVLFAHGSGSSRLSPRNQYVAAQLQKSRIATLLFDLLTPGEETIDNATAEIRFNIPLLAARLALTTRWVMEQQPTLSIGYFGASTGAAAALVAAAEMRSAIRAVVSRGGRPDLAKNALPKVVSPTLLIVGSQDLAVITLNELALEQLRCTKKMQIIEGATHLFEEKGKMEEVTKAALAWFQKYLP
jgi:putative phosphoribosyl transferase